METQRTNSSSCSAVSQTLTLGKLLSIYLLIYLSTYLPIYLSIYLPIYLYDACWLQQHQFWKECFSYGSNSYWQIDPQTLSLLKTGLDRPLLYTNHFRRSKPSLVPSENSWKIVLDTELAIASPYLDQHLHT